MQSVMTGTPYYNSNDVWGTGMHIKERENVKYHVFSYGFFKDNIRKSGIIASVGYHSTRINGSSTLDTKLVTYTLLKGAINLFITLLRNSLLYSNITQ